MARSRYSMRDVARLAGVSVATVSAVINGTANVSPQRLKRVREAMETLDYQPNQVARSLKVGETRVVGMVIPDITNAFYPEVICGAEEEARGSGYSVILCNSNEDPAQESRNLGTLFSRRVDGILIACSSGSANYTSLTPRHFPIVFIDRIPYGAAYGGVSTDNIDAGHLAVRHLIDLGHERIAIITGDLRLSPHAHRLEGFRRAMQEAGLPVRDEYLRPGTGQIESGYQAGLSVLGLRTPPTAIISSNNRMLLGLMRAISEARVVCPGHVSVVGFDDYAWTEHYTPHITVVAQQTYELGRRAMAMLIARIQSADRAPDETCETLLLKAELRCRESTAPPCRGSITAVPTRAADSI